MLVQADSRRLARLVVLAFLPAITGSGCKGLGGRASQDKAEGYEMVRLPDGGDTQVRLGPGSIPPEFPPGLALYPGAKFTSTGRVSKSVVIALDTADSADKVLAFYREQPGYSVTFESEVDGHRVLNMKHMPSAKELQVLAKPSGSQTQVSLVAPFR